MHPYIKKTYALKDGGKKLEKFEKELEYFAGYTIVKSLYADGVISFEVFDRINIGIEEKVEKLPNVAEARRFFNYPYTAIEESLANAIYHKGYDEREPIEVRVHTDRIEILSHPGADRSISIDGLKNYRVFNRRYRNRGIGEFLKEMHLTEGRNTGFGKIIKALEMNGSPKPLFETDEDRTFFAATIFAHPEFMVKESMPNGKENGKDNGKDNEQLVLSAVKNNPQITISEIAEVAELGPRTVSRIIKKLKSNGTLMRKGTKNGNWIILK